MHIDKDIPTDSLAAFVNSQISPEFNLEDADWNTLSDKWKKIILCFKRNVR